MPELRLKEVRMPELRLPEMSRDDITRAIGDARAEADLGRFDPRRLDLSEVEIPRVDLSRIDVPRAVASATQAASMVRARRPRLPFIIGGLITLGLVGFALLNSPAVRPRLAEAARRAKARIEEQRAERLELEADIAEEAEAVMAEAAGIAELEVVEMDAVGAVEADASDGTDDAPTLVGIPIEADADAGERIVEDIKAASTRT